MIMQKIESPLSHCLTPERLLRQEKDHWDDACKQARVYFQHLEKYFSRSRNVMAQMAAMLLLGSATATWSSTSSQLAAFGGVTIAMGFGSYFGGLRVTEVLAENVTKMNHAERLSANLTTSSLVLASGFLGLPVSTTHLSSSAIIGIGLLKGWKSVRWTTVRDMVLAWVVTLPASALLAGVAYLILTKVL